MSQIDKDRFFNMAECFDRMASHYVPRYDWLQCEVVELLSDEGRVPESVVDLGAGSGTFLERVLLRYPQCRVVWVDYSPDFHAVAKRRLERFGQRVEYVMCTLEDPWEKQLTAIPDAICSMSAIHHLETEEKKRLYKRCFGVLKAGGWFINVDEVAAPYEDAYLNTLRYWVRHIEQAVKSVPAELEDYSRAWLQKFENWKLRNVENRGQPKIKGDDIHDNYVEQLCWLHEAGFVGVDVLIKFQLLAAMAGRKP